MSCDRQLLSYYRDGALGADDRAVVELHLHQCETCTAELRGYLRLAQTIRSLPYHEAPRSLRSGLYQRLEDREAERFRSWLPAGFARAIASAAVLASAAMAFMIVVRPGAVETPQLVSVPAAAPALQSSSPGQPGSPRADAPSVVSGPKWAPGIEPAPTAVAQLGAAARPAPEILDGLATPMARLYRDNAAVRMALGLPATGSKTVSLVEQTFQGGIALWRADTREIYVLTRGAPNWNSYTPNRKSSTASSAADLKPPPGAFAPQGGFGTLWMAQPDVKAQLGWAVYEPRGFGGVIQAFERGRMIWSPLGLLYVLVDDGSWKVFPDAAAR